MKRILLISALVVGSMASLQAQTLKMDVATFHREGDFRAGFNSTGYQFDFAIGWFPIEYVGVKASAGLAGEIGDMVSSALNAWDEEYDPWYDDKDYAVRFRFTPALALRSPRLLTWKSQDAGLYIYAEPGVIISPGAARSRNPQICSWDIKAGFNLQYDTIILIIGYEGTSFNLYSGLINNAPVTHAGYIGCAIKF